jgi:hypothetical protein
LKLEGDREISRYLDALGSDRLNKRAGEKFNEGENPTIIDALMPHSGRPSMPDLLHSRIITGPRGDCQETSDRTTPVSREGQAP